MSFVNYKVGPFRQQIRDLLRKRLILKDRIRYHLKKIGLHKGKIDTIQKDELPKIEKQLDFYLERVGN